MYPESVESVRAESLADAARLLDEHGPRARILAGGQSLVPLMKFRLAVPDVVVDVSHIRPDDPITEEPDAFRVHALTTHRGVGDHAGLTETFDAVDDAIPQLADPQVRNVGTVGGALAEADPSGDWGPLLLATGGTIHTATPSGRRAIPADEFFTGPFDTELEPNEVITHVTLPKPAARGGGAYLKVKRRQGVYAVAAVGVHLELNGAEECTSVGVACTAVEPTYSAPSLGEVFVGERIDRERIAAGADRLAAELDPEADTHGGTEYKRNLCARLFERATEAARDRAKGQSVDVGPMGVA